MKTILIIIILFSSISVARGQQWRVYTQHNSGLPGSVLTLAYDESEHCIWMSSAKTFTKFDWLNWVVYDTSNSPLPYSSYKTIAIDSHNTKWIGSVSGGMIKFDGINWTIFDTSNSPITSQYIWVIHIDESDIKWIGTINRGLVKLEDTTWTIYDDQNSGIPERRIRALNSENHIKWIGTNSKGIGRFNDTSWIVYNSTNSGISYDLITDIDIDRENNKWISTSGGGLNKFNSIDSIWSVYFNPGFITCSLIDDSQNIKWMGSTGGGLYKFYNDTGLVNYTPDNSPMPSYAVNALSLDSNGNLWIGTAGGLAVFNETGIISGVNDPGIINTPVSVRLFQNYPNPFNPETSIKYALKNSGNVKLSVFDITGKLIQILVNENQKTGDYEVLFDGQSLPSGAYFYKIETADYNETRLMMLVK